MPKYRWCWRRGLISGPGRPMKPRLIGLRPSINRFVPVLPDVEAAGKEPIRITYDEFEALRLIDYKGLTQEEAADRMGVSRGTVWRCLDSARRKIAAMLVEGRSLVIEGGDFSLES
ncbi:DUF134 domain-containing protein [Candidatus Bathyarchaeota archaeon]|nr:DUF134 domain-containing protein [Candidatus Bathyarchaeota archaeon]MBS7629522.1 DUF134 domain-containing protein [Candidatus Bathyarchaeota archaeon]